MNLCIYFIKTEILKIFTKKEMLLATLDTARVTGTLE